ncbi:6-phosphogluconolactonase [Candidatus Planktophila dulcis]|jgi:6-phosphogluconolactonase|uniref:6-phosphogluconolactonase n=1 Tax=Candidatus Planktophila dulcis TaxID=1884914 RepID=A0AAD0E5K8_9ACTN|nr:6-phosphogluconolactonase [Candidatus Planktophila dulcis]ASY11705.1 6-phosphogluconolactonase [Candidatus Planktophila dulcis]ASY14293.1 6-phosphogluconolactonase [Candidatus Planktophila dulcis]
MSSDDFDAIVGDIDDELDLTLYADATELSDEVTVQILAAIEKGLKLKSQFHLVLTGGTLGVQISEALVNEFNADPDGFAGLHIWWSDERFVQGDSVERNAFPFHGTVTNTAVVIHEVLASDVAKSVEEAVSDYELALENVDIDLNILGLGPDGHVASLFPGLADVDDHRRIFAITDSPKPPAVRVSFTMSLINSAHEVWIVAAGESKADAVTKIIEGDLSIPASYVRGHSHTRLIVDTEAFFSE